LLKSSNTFADGGLDFSLGSHTGLAAPEGLKKFGSETAGSSTMCTPIIIQ
jgi:hypothetical protein